MFATYETPGRRFQDSPQPHRMRKKGLRPEAPEEGFEPPTRRLTAACSATELLRNVNAPLWEARPVSQAAGSRGGGTALPARAHRGGRGTLSGSRTCRQRRFPVQETSGVVEVD